MKRIHILIFSTLFLACLMMGCAQPQKGDAGASGAPGNPGTPGLPGTPGQDCNVTTLVPSHDTPTGGALITCGVNSVVVVNGASGANGAASYVIIGSIDPCGPSGGQDEIFLLMASGNVVALYTDSSSALTARLSYIRDGVGYTTTDNSGCQFNLTTDVNGLRTIQYTTPVAVGTNTSQSWQTY